MVRNSDDTSIPIKKVTRERLGKKGTKNESWDVLLNRLMNQMEVMEKERDLMKDVTEVITAPIKHHMMESTPEEIDSLDISGMIPELEKRIKAFWKKFAKKECE